MTARRAMIDRFWAPMLLVTLLLGIAPARATNEEFPTPPGFASGTRDVDGINLHYVMGGSGPLVVLCHGFGSTWYEWHLLMPELARTNTVVAVDLPGLGQSDAPHSYTAQDVAEVLYRFAKSFSSDQPFDLVAHDIGIWNTYPLVVRHQADIRRLVYMEAPIPDERLYKFPAFTPQGESLVWHFSFFAAGDSLPETLVAGRERAFFEHFIKEHATNKAVFTPAILDLYARSYTKPGTLHAAFEYYRALNEDVRQNVALRATKLAMPVLAIGGGGPGGLGTFVQNQLTEYASDVTGLVLPNCGHWLPEECTEALNAAVIHFLERDRNGSTP